MLGSITLRRAILSDMPKIALFDAEVNDYHPLITLPWASSSDRLAVFTARLSDFLAKKSKYYFISAVDGSDKDGKGEEIIGYLVGTYPETEWKEEDKGEWEADLPEGTKKELFGYFLPLVHKEQEGLLGKNMFELESLSIAASHQRRGIGSLLLDKWFSDVKIDEKEAPAFVVSSAYGKGLYEKYGWKEVKAIHVPLKDYGVEEGYTTWCMIREPKK